MASSYKIFNAQDKTTFTQILNEAIPLTASILSGTYDSTNILDLPSGLWTSCYDYPYLSSSANHIVDLTIGYSPFSDNSSSNSNQNAKKINMYNQMAATLVGYDHTGSILEFDADGNSIAGSKPMRNCVFMLFSRLLVKDGIKKGSFNLQLATGSDATPAGPSFINAPLITDNGAENDYRINSPAGEYGILYKDAAGGGTTAVGHIYYQAGVCVLSSSIFSGSFGRSNLSDTSSFEQVSRLEEISGATDGILYYFDFCNFTNTVELNSTAYFCRLNHNEFNYSTNPTYVSGSRIVVKQNSTDQPVSYISGIALYDANNVCVGIGKFSEILRKDSSTELVAKVRIDY